MISAAFTFQMFVVCVCFHSFLDEDVLFQVKRAFDHAYAILNTAVNPLFVHRDCSRMSILGRIIRVTDEVVRYRRWVDKTFTNVSQSSPPNQSPALQFPVRAPRSLSSSGSTSSVDSGGSSEVNNSQVM